MPADRGQQKSLAKHRKKRELAKKKAQERRLSAPSTDALLIRKALTYPQGPTYISSNWRETSEPRPPLVSVVVTRLLPDGTLLPGVAMVDRTCLGVKDGFMGRPVARSEFDAFLDRMSEAHGGMEPCELVFGQSVVFHALDYARTLGFAPNPDFPGPLFGPRPPALIDTPYATPERPIYVPGPDDDVRRVLAQLNKVRLPGSDGAVAPPTPEAMRGLRAGGALEMMPDGGGEEP